MAACASQVAELAIARAIALASDLRDHTVVHNDCATLPGLSSREDIKETLRCGIQEQLTRCFITAHGQLIDGGVDPELGYGRLSPKVLPAPVAQRVVLPAPTVSPDGITDRKSHPNR